MDDSAKPPRRMPVLFLGHGNPMNAITDNAWSRSWRQLALRLPRPRAVLCVSAHWYLRGTFVTGNAAPRTIHDFGGFPPALSEVQYPARGDAALVERVLALVPTAAARDDWGLDHGAWSVLVHLFPQADVPVVQLSIDLRQPPAAHVALGGALAALRAEGVLILASGNITHNLRHALTYAGGEPPPWAATFDTEVARALEQRDADLLTRALESPAGRMAHPSPDHYLPLLYAFGAADADDPVTFPTLGFDLGSLSMRSVAFGAFAGGAG